MMMDDARWFKKIAEMTKDEMIDEILNEQRVMLAENDLPTLKAMIVDFRLMDARKKLEADAGITIQRSIFGATAEDAE